MRRPTLYFSVGKHLFDVVLAVATLTVVWPAMLLIGAAIRLTLKPPVIFRQRRPGWHGQPFTMYKFRTMIDPRDVPVGSRTLSDAERITRFGRFLRSTSLDELPELVNVVRGEMSMVGPRPLLMEYLPRYTPEQLRRHEVRPGITGLAQVNGRNMLSWDEKFELDLQYVEQLSFSLDRRIVWQTVQAILGRRGIHAAEHATMPEFLGILRKESQTTSRPHGHQEGGM